MSGQPIDKINNFFFEIRTAVSRTFAGESDDLRARPDPGDYARTSAGNLKIPAAILACEADVIALREIFQKPHLWQRAWVVTNLVTIEEMRGMTGCVVNRDPDCQQYESSHRVSPHIAKTRGPLMLRDIPSLHHAPLALPPPGQKSNAAIFAAPTLLKWAPPHDTEVMHVWKIIQPTGQVTELNPETWLDPYMYTFSITI
jgi:hypothetical protein